MSDYILTYVQQFHKAYFEACRLLQNAFFHLSTDKILFQSFFHSTREKISPETVHFRFFLPELSLPKFASSRFPNQGKTLSHCRQTQIHYQLSISYHPRLPYCDFPFDFTFCIVEDVLWGPKFFVFEKSNGRTFRTILCRSQSSE